MEENTNQLSVASVCQQQVTGIHPATCGQGAWLTDHMAVSMVSSVSTPVGTHNVAVEQQPLATLARAATLARGYGYDHYGYTPTTTDSDYLPATQPRPPSAQSQRLGSLDGASLLSAELRDHVSPTQATPVDAIDKIFDLERELAEVRQQVAAAHTPEQTQLTDCNYFARPYSTTPPRRPASGQHAPPPSVDRSLSSRRSVTQVGDFDAATQPPPPTYNTVATCQPSAQPYTRAPASIAHSRRSRQSATSRRSVVVPSEAFDVVHRMTDALFQQMSQCNERDRRMAEETERERIRVAEEAERERIRVAEDIERERVRAFEREKRQAEEAERDRVRIAEEAERERLRLATETFDREKRLAEEAERARRRAAEEAERERVRLSEKADKEKYRIADEALEREKRQIEEAESEKERIAAENLEREKRTMLENFEREKRYADEAEREKIRLMEIAEVQREREEKRMDQEREERKLAMTLADKERVRMLEQQALRLKEERERAEAENAQRLTLLKQLAEEQRRNAVLEMELKHRSEQLGKQQEIVNVLGFDDLALPQPNGSDINAQTDSPTDDSALADRDVLFVGTQVSIPSVVADTNNIPLPNHTQVGACLHQPATINCSTTTGKTGEYAYKPTSSKLPAPVSASLPQQTMSATPPVSVALSRQTLTLTTSSHSQASNVDDVRSLQCSKPTVETGITTAGSYTHNYMSVPLPRVVSTSSPATQSQQDVSTIKDDTQGPVSHTQACVTLGSPLSMGTHPSSTLHTPEVTSVATPSVSTVPTTPVVTVSAPAINQPVVIVKQFQTPKPYSGQTSHKSFREHFERVAKANGWVSELEKMQNLALALEGPAVECLREVKEDETGAYAKIWNILAHRFGHLDEPERAMRKFDSRKQLDGEGVTEFEQALRTLYREAWPNTSEATKDSALKRKFEEGLHSPDMLQFLRLHARQDDFGQTVAKARQFAEAQEACRPKKAVRIVEATDKDHGASTATTNQNQFQPLLDGFQQVIQTVLQNQTHLGCVTSQPTANRQRESRPMAQSRRVPSPSPRPNNRSTATQSNRDTNTSNGNRQSRPNRSDSPANPPRENNNGNQTINYNYRSPSPYARAQDRSYSPGTGYSSRPSTPHSTSSRWSDRSSNRENYPPTQNQRNGEQNRTPQQWHNRNYQRPQGYRYQNDRQGQGTTPPQSPNSNGWQHPRPRPLGPHNGQDQPRTPPPQGRYRRSPGTCIICGRYGCHSSRHEQAPFRPLPQQGNAQAQEDSLNHQSSPPSGNAQRGPRQGERTPPQDYSRPRSH